MREGEIINGMKFIKDERSLADPNGRKRRVALFECHCGKKLKIRILDVKTGKSTSCGCNKGNPPKFYEENTIINGVKFIKSLGVRKVGQSGSHMQYGLFECPNCKKEWESIIANIKNGSTRSCCEKAVGWTKSAWTKRFKKIYLYKVNLYNDNESFIKIGITGNKNIKKRLLCIPYKYKILKVINKNTEYIYNLEKRFNRIFKQYKYKPLKQFSGQNECFKLKDIWI